MKLSPGDLVKVNKLVTLKYFAGKLGVVIGHATTFEATDIDSAAESGNYYQVRVSCAEEESHIFHEENLKLISKAGKTNNENR